MSGNINAEHAEKAYIDCMVMVSSSLFL